MSLNSNQLPPLPAGTEAVSDYHRLEPFDAVVQDAKVTIRVAADAASGGTPVRLLMLDENFEWKELPNVQWDGVALTTSIDRLAPIVAVRDAKFARALADSGANSPLSIVRVGGSNGDVYVAEGESGYFMGTVTALAAGDVVSWATSPGVACADAIGRATRTPRCTIKNATAAQDGQQVALRLIRQGVTYESAPAMLHVVAANSAPKVFEPPQSVTAAVNETVFFTAVGAGAGPLNWEWLRDGVPITGSNGTLLALATTAADAGKAYKISVRLSNARGSTESAAATLTVKGASANVLAADGAVLPGPNGTELYVPSGALKVDSVITVTRLPIAAGQMPEGFTALTDVVKIDAPGASFNGPMQLMVPVPELPAGHSIAFLSVASDGSVVMRRAASLGSLAGRLDAGVAKPVCSNLQNATQSGMLPKAVIGSLSVVAAVTKTENCASLEARVQSTTAPSITDQECQQESDFLIGGAEKTLLSRHVDCQLAVDTGTRVDVDYKRRKPATPAGQSGPWVVMSGGLYDDTIDEATTMELLSGGRLETRISIYGPGNRLNKNVSVRVRLVGATLNPAVAALGMPSVSSIRARFMPTCSDTSVCLSSIAPVLVNVPINGGWSAPAMVSIPLRDPGAGSQHSTHFDFSRIEYAAGANGFDTPHTASQDSNGRRPWSTRLEMSPRLTCDNGLARRGTQGCVFEDAAAVFDIDYKGAEAKRHIARAVQNAAEFPGLLGRGRFYAMDGSRALASFEASGKSLTRIRDAKTVRFNRSQTKIACANVQALPSDLVVDEFGDLVDPEPNRDCDEYPPASTAEGGRLLEKELSVAKISASHNRSAGAQLGAFYVRQRVRHDEKYWIAID